ncbi:hypothetical protein BJ170DRAFT_255412 [Xylariales sp. AK1849]|nr:hypothetical protein BJ170DRAFT_255412 [Xylariales sp. AK1849]
MEVPCRWKFPCTQSRPIANPIQSNPTQSCKPGQYHEHRAASAHLYFQTRQSSQHNPSPFNGRHSSCRAHRTSQATQPFLYSRRHTHLGSDSHWHPISVPLALRAQLGMRASNGYQSFTIHRSALSRCENQSIEYTILGVTCTPFLGEIRLPTLALPCTYAVCGGSCRLYLAGCLVSFRMGCYRACPCSPRSFCPHEPLH